MDKRIELDFDFKNKPYVANVLIKENDEGYTYIINLFDKQLSADYPVSFTLTAKDKKFIPEKPMSKDQLDLVDAMKEALRHHPDNKYPFTDYEALPEPVS